MRFEVFIKNWNIIIPIGLSIIAILFTAFKDFILPRFFKPKLKITYHPDSPYKRGPIVLNAGSSTIAVYDRFKIENVGRGIAKNARCQIFHVEDLQKKPFDLQGYALMWTSRPESTTDFSKVERLNIGLGESEFVELAYMRTDNTTQIYFNKYPNIPTGMDESLYIGDYIIKVIISGDNFKPLIVTFKVFKKFLGLKGLDIKLLGIKRK